MESNGNRRIVGNLAGLHPFSVFPEEVWPLIGQKLGDSVEILKLIQTIPEIEGAMHAKKRYWIFDQIIPLLSKFLTTEDKLACRQVCSQWSQAVDNFLENYPAFRAYDHETRITGQIWTTTEGRPMKLYERYDCLPKSSFDSELKINNFLEKMGTPPGRWRNPFMHRVVRISSTEDIEFLTGMRKILEPFGHHIWYLWMIDQQHREPELFCNSLREWLDHVPNLKALVVGTDMRPMLPAPDDVQGGAYLQRWNDKPLPPLRHLEGLAIISSIIPPAVVKALVTSYSGQIRILCLTVDQWKPEFHTAFPKLTELVVVFPSTAELNSLLLGIQSPLLYNLELIFTNRNSRLEMETDIFPWLSRFPLLRNLSLIGFARVIGNDKFSPAACSVPSIKYIRVGIQFPHANSDFLLCFPHLEYIDLQLPPQPMDDPPLEPTLQIWQPLVIGRMYESNIWELLPKLKGICVTPHGDDEVEVVRFKRDTYAYQKKLLAQA